MPVKCFYTVVSAQEPPGRQGKDCGWIQWWRGGSNWLFGWMSSVTTPVLGCPVLCPAVICKEFGVIGNCSSETHQAVSSSLFHIKLKIFAVVRGTLVAFPSSACSLHISVGWCLATPSATQIPSSRKQHGKVCGANMIYWFIFRFIDIWDWWLFPQTVCTQSCWNGTVCRVKGSWKIHNCLTGIHAPLMGTREKNHASKVWGDVCSSCLCLSFFFFLVFFVVVVYIQGTALCAWKL